MSWLITQQVVTLPPTWVKFLKILNGSSTSSEKRNIYISRICEAVRWSNECCKRIEIIKSDHECISIKILPSGLICSKRSCDNQFRTIIAWGCWKWASRATRTTSCQLERPQWPWFNKQYCCFHCFTCFFCPWNWSNPSTKALTMFNWLILHAFKNPTGWRLSAKIWLAANLILKLLPYLRQLCEMMMLLLLPLKLIKSIHNCLSNIQMTDFACF